MIESLRMRHQENNGKEHDKMICGLRIEKVFLQLRAYGQSHKGWSKQKLAETKERRDHSTMKWWWKYQSLDSHYQKENEFWGMATWENFKYVSTV